jgi:hypothetical protein
MTRDEPVAYSARLAELRGGADARLSMTHSPAAARDAAGAGRLSMTLCPAAARDAAGAVEPGP